MAKVTILMKWISHYRVPFYETLRSELSDYDIELSLIYGEPYSSDDRKKRDWCDVLWAKKIQNIPLLNERLLWQPALQCLKDSDLVIVEHANKLLINYVLQIKRVFGSQKLAFWGHGRNFQSSGEFSSRIKEKWKQSIMFQVDWWFAYNSFCAAEIGAKGFPFSKITRVENAIDTSELIDISSGMDVLDIDNFKDKHGISSDNIGIFVGGMFKEKRLKFLIESALEVKKVVHDFEIVFIGAGTDQSIVEEADKKYPWVHYLGPLFGREKVLAMKAGSIYLLPGLVGLGILDAFALDLPVITTDYEFHSPEFSYISDGENGRVTENSQSAYSAAIVECLLNEEYMAKLKSGCQKTARIYSIENMAKNFSQGVMRCLAE